MSDLLDLFDDDPPEPGDVQTPLEPGSNPVNSAAQAPAPPPAATPTARPAIAAQDPCARPAAGGHVCRVGGGLACFSDDGERTWFCPGHAPAAWGLWAGGPRAVDGAGITGGPAR